MHSKCIVYITSYYQEGTIFISIIHEVTEGHNGYITCPRLPRLNMEKSNFDFRLSGSRIHTLNHYSNCRRWTV